MHEDRVGRGAAHQLAIDLVGREQVVAAAAFLIAAVFLIPMTQEWLLPLFWFGAKTGSILFLFMWVRGTLPRFRYDQLMGFTWKWLFPAAMLNLLATGFLIAWLS